MLELDDVPAPREPMTVPRKKRRGCLISIFVFLFVIVPGLLLFLNGPGFRLFARYAGLKAAAGQGEAVQADRVGHGSSLVAMPKD